MYWLSCTVTSGANKQSGGSLAACACESNAQLRTRTDISPVNSTLLHQKLRSPSSVTLRGLPLRELLTRPRKITMDSSRRKVVHWAAPTTLVASFAAGVAFAVGHHCFYNYLGGRRVDESSTQQYNISIGTAFSLLVRAALVVAITTTYWQIFMHRLRRNLPFATIDSLASLLGAPYELLNSQTLKASPLLVTLAILTWLIPVAVVFTPGTLTVESTSETTPQPGRYATLNWTHTESFASLSLGKSDTGLRKRNQGLAAGTIMRWEGPSIQLGRSSVRMAYASELPVFPALAQNTSYSVSFHGPAVQCGDARIAETLQRFTDAVGGCENSTTWLTNCLPVENKDTSNSSYYYIAGVTGSPTRVANSSMPISLDETLGFDDASMASILMAHRDSTDSDAWTVLNCSLYNASYNVLFDFMGERQIVRVTEKNILGPVRRAVRPEDYYGIDGPLTLSSNEVKSYFAAMQTLGTVLVGALWHVPQSSLQPESDKAKETHILHTALAFSKEILPLYDRYNSGSLQSDLASRPALASAIEELFQNMTLSMFSIPSLFSVDTYQTEINTREYFNIYRYNWPRLALAYGIAIVLTLLAVVLGVYMFSHTGMSFSNKFSTTIRISRGEDLGLLIGSQDRRGEDPLPKHIAKAKVTFFDNQDPKADGRAIDDSNSRIDSDERASLRG